jgi:general stress protein YciG
MQKIRYLIPALITCLVIWLLFMLMKQPQSDGIEILEHEYSPRLRALYKKVCTLHKKPIRVIEIKGPSPRTTVARVLSPRRTRFARGHVQVNEDSPRVRAGERRRDTENPHSASDVGKQGGSAAPGDLLDRRDHVGSVGTRGHDLRNPRP